VPAQKCSKIKWNSLLNFNKFSVRNPIFFFKKKIVLVRTYSTSISKDNSYSSDGHPVNIYEKCSSEGFKLIGSFVSARRASKFLDISGSTVVKYMK